MESDSKELNIIFPDEILNGKKIESVIVSPINNKIGVATLSGKTKNMYLLRIYHISMEEKGIFIPTHEIGAFTFYTKQQLLYFTKSLPEMSALELLMLMNQKSVYSTQ